MPRAIATALVRARPGVRVPREGAPRQYITEDQARPVPLTAYYRRQLQDGDLVIVQPEASKAPRTGATPALPPSTPEE